MEVQALYSIQLQVLKAFSCKFYKQGMQQFWTLMKYNNVFFQSEWLTVSFWNFWASPKVMQWSSEAEQGFWNQEAWALFHSEKKRGEQEREGGKKSSIPVFDWKIKLLLSVNLWSPPAQ